MASSSADDIFADLQANFNAAAEEGEFDEQLDNFMENDAVPVWKSNSPTDTGEYKDSVGVTQLAHGGKGQIGATDDIANIVEFGAEHTEEFAPRAKTEAHFDRGAS